MRVSLGDDKRVSQHIRRLGVLKLNEVDKNERFATFIHEGVGVMCDYWLMLICRHFVDGDDAQYCARYKGWVLQVMEGSSSTAGVVRQSFSWTLDCT